MVILCGGRGTRLQERTQSIPKPMVEIGGRPILWHVIQIYLAQGFRRFLLLTGYRGDQVSAFVAGEAWPDGTEIRCLDTGRTPRRVAGCTLPPQSWAGTTSASHTPTAWPTSIWGHCWRFTPAMARRRR